MAKNQLCQFTQIFNYTYISAKMQKREYFLNFYDQLENYKLGVWQRIRSVHLPRSLLVPILAQKWKKGIFCKILYKKKSLTLNT